MAARSTITELSLCAGVGWLSEGLRAGLDHLGFGHRTVCHVERDAYAVAVLVARMEESSVEQAPVWDDLATFDGRAWRGVVDIVSAGLPCQPYSCAGKQLGLADHRSYGDGDGPIPHALRIIAECQPAVVFFENVPTWVTGGWFRPVGEELCRLGYTLEDPLFVTAESVGASHRRERVFVLAYRAGVDGGEWQRQRISTTSRAGGESGIKGCCEGMDDADSSRPHDSLSGTNERKTGQRSGECVPRDGCAAVADAIGADIHQTSSAGAGTARGTVAASTSRAVAVNGRLQRRFSEPWRGPDRGSTAGGTGGAMGDATRESEQGRRREHASERISGSTGGSLFAPGPGLGLLGVVDDILELFREDPETAWRRFEAERRNTERWIDILREFPHLCPKIEPGVRGFLDGQEVVLDESRADQLRCSGNGVVALCAAAALVELVRRAGLDC